MHLLGPLLGSVVAEAMPSGSPSATGGKVTIWRGIDRVGAGVVVDGAVETIAAGLRGMRAPCSGEREGHWARGEKLAYRRLDRRPHSARRIYAEVAPRVRPRRSPDESVTAPFGSSCFLWLSNRRQGKAET